MKKVNVIRSMAAPWLAPNIDTEVILSVGRLIRNFNQLEKFTFEPYRYLDDKGEVENPEFPLNDPKYRGAKIMLCGPNFGCGGGREEAAVGLVRMGIECIIASSFSAIFTRICFLQGILPVVLPEEDVKKLAVLAPEGPIEVSLPEQTVTGPDGSVFSFEIDQLRREMLLEGLDDVGSTLKHSENIERFLTRDSTARPWIYR